jgi:hypothetical protein
MEHRKKLPASTVPSLHYCEYTLVTTGISLLFMGILRYTSHCLLKLCRMQPEYSLFTCLQPSEKTNTCLGEASGSRLEHTFLQC